MKNSLSAELRSAILQAALGAVASTGTINIPVLAEEIRRANERENVALEDIEYELLQLAQRLHAPIEFDGRVAGVVMPVAIGDGISVVPVPSAPIRD